MRRLPRRERGQAALLAVLGLLILAVGMYTSYNLSRAVYEKIQLQNAADATAYSVATMEARTFNFIAFANRAQAANYVMMLEAQSLLSNASYLEGVFGYTGDLLLSWGNALEPFARFFSYLEPLVEALLTAGELARDVYNGIEPRVDSMEEWSTRYLQLQTTKNQALFAVSAMVALSTALQIASGGQEIARMNDANARYTWASWALTGVNAASYASAFDQASFGMLASSEDVKQAKRLMTEIVHGSRYSSPALGEDFVVARESMDSLMTLISALESVVDTPTRRKGKPAIRSIGRVLNALTGPFVGTAKMLETGDPSQVPNLDDTKLHDPSKSDMTTGEWLTAKDQGRLLMLGRLSKIGFASIVSGVDDFRHCRYGAPSGYGGGPFNFSRAFNLTAIGKGNARIYGFEDCYDGANHAYDHRWRSVVPGLLRGGMASYLKFAPRGRGFSVERNSFNQPDVWIMLNKRPERMALGGPGDLDFDLGKDRGARRQELDARIGEAVRGGVGEAFFPDGINVMARAQVYYHRPGAWQEPPNFFNPYWGARLAPKNVAIKRLTSELGLDDEASQLIADNVWMH